MATVRALVVAGGGAGALDPSAAGGGGGGGGVLEEMAHAISVGSYSIVVGLGGTVTPPAAPTAGQNSSFDTMIAIGGGLGGNFGNVNGGNGGSGGGGGPHASSGGNGTVGQGNNGGGAQFFAAGGGGGATQAGTSGDGSQNGGKGGDGYLSNISGTATRYGGGGGGYGNNNGGAPGLGGGGQGGTGSLAATQGTDGLGGGGGGGTGGNGNGGRGVVIISYPFNTLTATGGTITYDGINRVHTFNSNGTFTVTSITAFTTPPLQTGAFSLTMIAQQISQGAVSVIVGTLHYILTGISITANVHTIWKKKIVNSSVWRKRSSGE